MQTPPALATRRPAPMTTKGAAQPRPSVARRLLLLLLRSPQAAAVVSAAARKGLQPRKPVGPLQHEILRARGGKWGTHPDVAALARKSPPATRRLHTAAGSRSPLDARIVIAQPFPTS